MQVEWIIFTMWHIAYTPVFDIVIAYSDDVVVVVVAVVVEVVQIVA